MDIVIMAGGLPSTLVDTGESIPKPMVEIGEYPLLLHIMKHFSYYGYHDFIICGGYKVNMIKDYFKDFYIYHSDITVDLRTNQIFMHKNISEDWKVTVLDTGIGTTINQRILQTQKYIRSEDFFVTFGDCISDIEPDNVSNYHKEHGKMGTMVVAKPTGRNSAIEINKDGFYSGISENISDENQTWVDSCNYIINKKIFNITNQNSNNNQTILEILAEQGQMKAFKHNGFWMPVETVRDRNFLEQMWESGNYKWKIN